MTRSVSGQSSFSWIYEATLEQLELDQTAAGDLLEIKQQKTHLQPRVAFRLDQLKHLAHRHRRTFLMIFASGKSISLPLQSHFTRLCVCDSALLVMGASKLF